MHPAKVTFKVDENNQVTVMGLGPVPVDGIHIVVDAPQRVTTYRIMVTVRGPLMTVVEAKVKPGGTT